MSQPTTRPATVGSSAVTGPAVIGRRRLLALGGASAAAAAFLAACGDSVEQPPARVGQAPLSTALPTVTTTDAVWMRTASSLEHSTIKIYEQALKDPQLLDPANTELITALRDEHTAALGILAEATTAAGGEVWTCSNPRLDSALLVPAMTRITVGDPDAKIPASDDMKRDTLNLLHALESLAASTHQELAGTLNAVDLRATALGAGLGAARRAARLALVINKDRPGGYVSVTDATNAGVTLPVATTVPPAGDGPVPTEIPTVAAVPSQFGLLGSLLLVVGAGDENGVRLKANVETPRDNTLIYATTPAC